MEHTRTITREFETGDKAVLHIEARSGAVLVESHDAARVHVEAVVHVWSDLAAEADEAASLVERGMEQDAHRVMVRAPSLPQTEGWSLWGGKRGSRVDYTVRVPLRTAVRVLSKSGRVQIARTEGRVHLESGSGRLSIDDVTGDVLVISRSGSLSIERVRGDVSAEVRSGRTEVHGVTGTATLQSRSGATDVRDVTGDLDVTAHTGAVMIDGARAAVRVRAHTGTIRYRGKVEGDIDMKTQTGLIHLAVDPERPFFIDAESQIGAVKSDLPPRRGGGSANGAGPKVRLRTHTGAIRLTRM
jgi:Putative adhesin